ncbi:transposase, partial [Streptococcus pneumoniae]
VYKRRAFGFRNFENFKKERTKFVLSISSLSSTHYS